MNGFLCSLRRARAPNCFTIMLSCTAAFIAATSGLRAQSVDFTQFPAQPLPDTATRLVPAYGFNDDEFSIGAYAFPTSATDGHADSVWPFLRSIGVRILELRTSIQYQTTGWCFDTLANELHPRDTNGRWQERLIVGTPPYDLVGHAHSLTFFPFDSSESYYWPCKFLQRAGGKYGVNTGNADDRDYKLHPLQERIFSYDSTMANQVVLSHLVAGYEPLYHTHQWRSQSASDDSVEIHGDIFRKVDHWHTYTSHQTMYAVVKAHLFDPQTDTAAGTANDTDAIFAVEMWNEIPQGTRYLRGGTDTATAAVDTSFLYTTLLVHKSDLTPVVDPITHKQNFAAYLEVEFPVDMIRNGANGPGGPWNDVNTQGRFDVRVHWTGKEKAALRSVTLRDSMSQLVFGADTTYRDMLHQVYEYILRGRDWSQPDSVIVATDTTKPIRFGRIIRMYSGDEGYYNEQSGYNYLDSSLYRVYRDTTLTGRDTLARGIRGWRAQAYYSPQQYLMSSQQEISVESYPFWVDPGIVADKDSPDALHVARFGLPQHVYGVPSIREHNGGRMAIPLLDVQPGRAGDRDSVELYSEAWNRLSLGANYDVFAHRWWPYDNTTLSRLGQAAWASRRTGRRLIQWPGVHFGMYLSWFYDSVSNTSHRDTVYTHVTEPAELRGLLNVGLAYGSRGIQYSQLGWLPHSYGNPVWIGPGANDSSRNYAAEFSIVGAFNDLQDTETVTLNTDANWSVPTTDVLNSLWTGYGIHRKEIIWLDSVWLPRISAELRQLHWRDAYSIHYTTPQTYWDAATHMPNSRPLPSNEIVTGVEAYDRYGNKDSAMNTFVELGLFDTQKDTSELHDVNHIFVVNRRSFERGGDIDSTSSMGMHLDSLAEVRTLMIQLNIHHPVDDHYNFVHVQEIAADTTRLPLTYEPRHALDTILFGDSVIALTLRPGGAALLRISFCPPELALGPGRLERNGQRKLLYDGNRYYACWVRQRTCYFPFNQLPANQHPDTTDVVYFRRSLPMHDTTGAIQWEPDTLTYVVSDTTNEGRFKDNRYPSMTLRKVGHDSTVVTVVWSSYNTDSAGFGHTINLRNIMSIDTVATPLFGPFEKPGYSHGYYDAIWGTPVVSCLHGCEMVAWSDSLHGILARARRHTTTWNSTGAYGSSVRADTVSLHIGPWNLATSAPPYRGRFPSMPPFTDLMAEDSSVAIVWLQPLLSSTHSVIYYARLIDNVASNAHFVTSMSHRAVSGGSAILANPSIDASPAYSHALEDGIVWDEMRVWNHTIDNEQRWQTWMNFCSVWTPTATISGKDTLGYSQLRGTSSRLITIGPTVDHSPEPYLSYPNVTALNEATDSTDFAHGDSLSFSTLARNQFSGYFKEIRIQYGAIDFLPHGGSYAYAGKFPSGSAAPLRVDGRFAALYQVYAGDTDHYNPIHTTRQFFAKDRPAGYVAKGRRAAIHLSDTAFGVMTFELHDVWFADPTQSAGVGTGPMLEATPWAIDSLSGVRRMMRSAYFHAHDSTTIGCELYGVFHGDTTGRSALSVRIVAELVDSSSDVAVGRLDSFAITIDSALYSKTVTNDFDLLSGTYYVRLSIDTSGISLDSAANYVNYSVGGLESDVDMVMAKIRLGARGESTVRVTAQPNPSRAMTDVRYSVPEQAMTSVRLYDITGRFISTVVEPAEMAEGRYTAMLDCSRLPAGTYVLEVRTGRNRASERLIVQ